MISAKQGAIRGIVFDFDGTLIDSAPDLRITANKVLEAAGRRAVTLEEVQGMIGDGMPKLVERVFRATGGVPAADELKSHIAYFLGIYTGTDADPDQLYPGAVETLETLQDRGYTLGLCTNKAIAPTRVILHKFGIERFFAAVSGGDSIPGVRKPDPRHLLAVIEDLGLEPDETIMIGDKEHDIYCARDAGVRSLIVSFGYAKMPIAEIGADGTVDRLSEIPDAIERLP